MGSRITIIGQGLAGTCLAWRLWDRGKDIHIVHRGDRRGSSLVSAGLLTPVTGKGMNPSWRIDEFQPEAMRFYRMIEMILGEQFFHEVPILRLFTGEEERAKFEGKRDELEPWIAEVVEPSDSPIHAEHGGVVWRGGGWLDTRRFLEASKGYFREHGLFEVQVLDLDERVPGGGTTVQCVGAAGLGSGPFAHLPERRAKGEILTVRILGFSEQRILSRKGWLIPLGGGLFRAGATYDWDDLNDTITPSGRTRVEEIIGSFTDLPFEVIEHVAGVRPIVRRSQPVIGPHPDDKSLYIFNGLGSKGVLYAPGVGDRLAAHLGDGAAIEDDLHVQAVVV